MMTAKKTMLFKWIGSVAVVAVAGVSVFLVLGEIDTVKTYSKENKQFIPALIDSRDAEYEIAMVIKNSTHEFFEGIKSETRGFSQSYLGPTIRLYQGEQTRISFKNQIEDATTVHGHGLHVNGDVDGGPQGEIAPGTAKSVTLRITQEAGTSWYHPHLMGKTAEHVHSGLAGLYIIEDENSQTLPLPKAYGLDDIPLIVQDRSFVDGKMRPYTVNNNALMDGLREETLIVNGTVNPRHTVPAGWVRLRLLNASNARFYRFFFAEDAPFYKIATEGGFLNKPVEITEITMAPGERNEIMVDLSNKKTAALMAEFLSADPEGIDFEAAEGLLDMGEYLSTFIPQNNPVQRAVELITDASLPAPGVLPDALNDIDFYTPDDKQKAVKRDLVLEMDMAEDNGPIGPDNMFTINGRSMDMDTVNARVGRGSLELWTITAEMMPHPFHVHGVSFQILTHNGQPPLEADRGWKDTVVVTAAPTEILMRFNHIATDQYPYMFHCHVLEHEDTGMMGQFTVQ